VRALLNKKLIKFSDFLSYFNYLSSYRIKFLHVYVDDIEQVFLDDEKGILTLNYDNIGKLNLQLVLSNEYGLTRANLLNFLSEAMLKIIRNKAFTADIQVMKNIFIKIIDNIPQNYDQQEFIKDLLNLCSFKIQSQSANNFIEVNYSEDLRTIRYLLKIFK